MDKRIERARSQGSVSESRFVTSHLILLDDGAFFIKRSINGDAGSASGHLLHRCGTGLGEVDAYECVGIYEREPSGAWGASINVPGAGTTGSNTRRLGPFRTNHDAITALWKARRDTCYTTQE
ncbi:hypothetical protein [Paraburkholderia flagellata]|uniref:hypothetical protein n=1 Tax=Paraburkholderia flagellata TaxID=2883241 RepID=UPI001F26BCB5|nr:hypothetical protein [Paraburkholderia flagellata]